jgi:hypothetical protein
MKFVESRAKRILGKMDAYHAADSTGASGWSVEPEIGTFFGRYENAPDHYVDVGEHGIVIQDDDRREIILYRQLQRIEVPGEKTEANQCTLHVRNGQQVLMHVAGGKGQTRDVWEFLRFLNRAIKEAAQDSETFGDEQRRVV